MSVGAPLPLKILFLIRKIVNMRLHTKTNGNVVLEKPSLRFSGVDEAKATKKYLYEARWEDFPTLSSH